MSVVLVIEPDQKQASLLRTMQKRVEAELVLVQSTDEAIDAIGRSIPDVILLSSLLSPRDEDRLVTYLRSLEGASHLQTLTIPQLQTKTSRAPATGKKGFGFRKKKETTAPTGCDPAAFAEEITAQLARAQEIRSRPRSANYPILINALVPAASAVEPPTTATAPVDRPIADPWSTERFVAQPMNVEPAYEEPAYVEPAYVEPEVQPQDEFEIPALVEANIEADIEPILSDSADDDLGKLARELGLSLESEMAEQAEESAECMAAEVALVQAETEEKLAAELERVRAESEERRLAELARLQADADAMREAAIAEARAAAEEETRRALASEVARVRSEAEGTVAEAVNRVKIEAEQTLTQEIGRAREDAEALRADLARAQQEAAETARALELEVAAVREQAEAHLKAELERIGKDAERARAADQTHAKETADQIRDAAAREARAIAEDAARRTLAAEIARVRSQADTVLETELARVRAEAQDRQTAELMQLREQMDELRRHAAEQARVAEQARIAADQARAAAAQQARAAEEARAAEQERVAELKRAAERARIAEEARIAEQARVEELTRAAAAQQARAAEEARAAEQERVAELKRAAERARIAEEARIAEQARVEELTRAAAAQQARAAEEARKAEQERLAELKRAAERARVAEEARAVEQARVEELTRAAAAQQAREAEETRRAEQARAEQARLERQREAEDRAPAAVLSFPVVESPSYSEEPSPKDAGRRDYYSLWQPNPERPAEQIEAQADDTPGTPFDYARWLKWGIPIAASIILVAVSGIDTVARFASPSPAEPSPRNFITEVPQREVKVVADSKTGTLKVESTPGGAQVTLDGESRGTTPLTIGNLRPGSHTLVLRSPAGNITRRVTIRAGQMAIASEAIFAGWLAIFSPIPLDVSLNGKLAAPADDGRFMIAPGTYQVEVVNSRFNFRRRETLTVKPGEVTAHTVSLPTGALKISVPDGTDVTVDGQAIGKAPFAAALPFVVGTHEVKATHPEFGERRAAIDVKFEQTTEAALLQP